MNLFIFKSTLILISKVDTLNSKNEAAEPNQPSVLDLSLSSRTDTQDSRVLERVSCVAFCSLRTHMAGRKKKFLCDFINPCEPQSWR